MKLRVQGIGVVGGFGSGAAALSSCLGERRWPTPVEAPAGFDGTATVPALLADASRLTEFLPKGKLRWVDQSCRMAVLAAYLALEDAGLLASPRHRTGLIIATGYGASRTTFGFLDSLLDGGSELASPMLFARSLHNTAGAHVSLLLGLGGPSLSVSQLELSVPSALLGAKQWLEEGRVDRVLLGGVDEFCEVLGYSKHRFEVEPGRASTRKRRAPIPIGEGAFCLVLERDDSRPTRYGSIVEVGLGVLGSQRLEVADDAVLFLGPTGKGAWSCRVEEEMLAGRLVARYAPLYGCTPIALGFDAAIAALSIEKGRVFPTEASTGDALGEVIGPPKDLGSRGLSCLRVFASGEYGLIRLEAD